MLKDLNLSTHPRDGQILTGNINVCNVQAKSSGLNTVTLIVSGDPERKIVFAFPDNLAPDEPYTAVIQLPRKVVEVVNVPEIDIPVEIPLAAEEYSEVHVTDTPSSSEPVPVPEVLESINRKQAAIRARRAKQSPSIDKVK